MYFAAAMAIGSMISAHEQRKAQMKAKAADAKLQRAKLERARMRSTEDFVANSQRAREASQKREIQIEENRVQAESKIDTTFAGSGISGQSVSELDKELETAVQKNKFENRKALDTQLSDLSKDYSDTMTDTAYEAQGIDTARVKGTFLGDALIGAQGFSSGLSISSSMGFQGGSSSGGSSDSNLSGLG